MKSTASKKLASTLLAAALAGALVPVHVAPAVALESNDNSITSWDAAKKGDTYVFTLETNGEANAAGNKTVSVSYADGHSGNNCAFQTTWDASEVKGGHYQDINGASIKTSGSTVTITIPASYFENDDFTVSFGGSSIKSSDMGAAGDKDDSSKGDSSKGDADKGDSSKGDAGSSSGSGSEKGDSGSSESGSSKPSATYNGITIDGDFSDWDAVTKYDVDDDEDVYGNKKTWDTVNGLGMVWDGDWVYLYFESNADDPGAVTGAGPHSNGQFAITTDLGNQTLIQLQRGNGTLVVSGVDGASIKVNNYDWAKTPHKCEVAIPASLLGDYRESISFGMYLVEPTITGVKDLQGSKGGEFNGIVYDGEYADWTYYPHTTIQYATSGTGEHVVDAKGALYADNSSHTLYGHAVTTMPEHVNDGMGAIELSHAISLRVNGDDDLMLTPRFVAVDDAGNIDWNSDPSTLPNGTYEFYLFSTTCNATSANINDLQNDDVCYGKAKITITDGRAETEWEIDIPTLAEHLHANWGQAKEFTSIDADSIKKFEVQYGRLGQQWITTAGTSTAPFVGVGLCLAAVGGAYAWRRKKGAATPATATAAGSSGSEV